MENKMVNIQRVQKAAKKVLHLLTAYKFIFPVLETVIVELLKRTKKKNQIPWVNRMLTCYNHRSIPEKNESLLDAYYHE